MEETTAQSEAAFRAVNVAAAEKLARAAARAGADRFALVSTVKVNDEASVNGRPLNALHTFLGQP